MIVIITIMMMIRIDRIKILYSYDNGLFVKHVEIAKYIYCIIVIL